MIKFAITLDYPGLTLSEQQRLADVVGQYLQHHVVTRACTMTQDPRDGEGEGEFIKSLKLDVKIEKTVGVEP